MSEPKEWKDMPDSIKGMIVKQLDLPARTRFKMCSKADKRLVDSIPFEVDEVKADDPCEKYPPFVVFPGQVMLIQIGNLKVCKSRAGHAYVSIEDSTKKRGYCFSTKEQASKFVLDTFAQILIHGNIHVNRFVTSVSFPEKLREAGFKIKAKRIEIGTSNEKDTVNWLKHLDPCVNEIFVESKCDREGMHNGIGLIPEIINAKNLYIVKHNNIDDEQFAALKSTKLNISHSKVTEKGLNMLMKKWIDESYPIGSKIEHSHYYIDIDKILRGLKYETINDPITYLDGIVIMDREKELDIRWWKDDSGWPICVRFSAEVRPNHGYFTTNWNDMPSEMKKMIIERMDDRTKMQLKMCSKSDKCIVESSFCCLTTININGSSFSCFDNKESNRRSFTVNDNQHIVSIQLNDKKQDIVISKTARKWIKKAISTLLSISRIQIDDFFSLMGVSTNIRSRKTFIKLHTINIYADVKSKYVLYYKQIAPSHIRFKSGLVLE